MSDSSVSRQSIAAMIMTMPMRRKNWTTTSCDMRSMNDWRFAVSPEIRFMTEPVEVLS